MAKDDIAASLAELPPGREVELVLRNGEKVSGTLGSYEDDERIVFEDSEETIEVVDVEKVLLPFID